MRNRDTIEFLGLWESLHNLSFKTFEFDGFKKEAGLNAFTMSKTKWIMAVGRYGGTFGLKAKEWREENVSLKG